MDRDAPVFGRMLERLDADPAVAALRGRGAVATVGDFRSMRGAWAAAVLRALWRFIFDGPAPAAPAACIPRPPSSFSPRLAGHAGRGAKGTTR